MIDEGSVFVPISLLQQFKGTAVKVMKTICCTIRDAA